MGEVNREGVLNREGQHVFLMRKRWEPCPRLGKGLAHQEMAIKTEVLGVSQEHPGDQQLKLSEQQETGVQSPMLHRPYSFVGHDKDFGLSSW